MQHKRKTKKEERLQKVWEKYKYNDKNVYIYDYVIILF